MHIGDDPDPQPQARRPAGRRQRVGLQAQPEARLDRKGVAADEPEGRSQEPFEDRATGEKPHAAVPSGPAGAKLAISALCAPRSTTTISGGTPNRTGRMLVPRPPDTMRWRSSSTTCP